MKYLIFIIVFMFSVVCNAQTFIKGKALIEVPATTATAAGTTTLTTASQTNQQFTGSTTQTVVLPNATTLPNGRSFFISNRSSGIVTLNYNGGSLAQSLAAGTEVRAYLISNGSAAGTWDISYLSASGGITSIVAGSGLVATTITSTGTLTVDSGTTANKIVKLTSGAQYPSVDGFLITNINVTQGNVTGALSIANGGTGATSRWYINANFSGGDPSVAAADHSTTYTELTDGSMTLTPLAGSAAVGTMCSTTNAATAPSTSPTICAAGSESLGIAFNIPTPDYYKVCFYSGSVFDLQASAVFQPVFAIIETPTNAQTVTYIGGAGVGFVQQAVTVAVETKNGFIITACGIFDWSAVAANTLKGVRLMNTLTSSGTVTQALILCDAANLRNCGFTAERVR